MADGPYTTWDPDRGPSGEADRAAVPKAKPYRHPAAGWGAAIAVGKFMVGKEHEPFIGPKAILKMNHESAASTAPAARGPTRPTAWTSISARTASSTSPGR